MDKLDLSLDELRSKGADGGGDGGKGGAKSNQRANRPQTRSPGRGGRGGRDVGGQRRENNAHGNGAGSWGALGKRSAGNGNSKNASGGFNKRRREHSPGPRDFQDRGRDFDSRRGVSKGDHRRHGEQGNRGYDNSASSRGSGGWNRRGDQGRGGRRGGFGGSQRGGREGGWGSRKRSDLPRLSHLATKVEHSTSEQGDLTFTFQGNNIICVKSSGEINICCAIAERNRETARVANMVLRPLCLQIISADSRDLTTQWYLTNGKDYKVKCLENSVVSGPINLKMSMPHRVEILLELLGAKILYVDLEDKLKNVSTVTNAVNELLALCRENKWQEPKFHFLKGENDGQEGYTFSLLLPDFGIQINRDPQNWDSNFLVAKNKVALKALKTLKALKG